MAVPPPVRPLASTITPMKPSTSPHARRGPICSWKNMNATIAVNGTAMAFVMAPMPTGARSAAQANSANGIAELMAAIAARRNHRPPLNCERTRHRNGTRMIAPSARRISTSANDPKSFAETRMNRNEAPQIAPSATSSIGVSQELTAADDEVRLGALAEAGSGLDMQRLGIGAGAAIVPIRAAAGVPGCKLATQIEEAAERRPLRSVEDFSPDKFASAASNLSGRAILKRK